MMDFFKSFAPMLATAVTGPLGGIAVKAIGDAIGIEAPTIEAIKDVVNKQQLSAEQLAAIQQAEKDFEFKMKQLGFDNVQALEKLGNEDRADARQREIKTGDWVQKALAMMVTVGFFVVLFVLIFHGKPAEGGDALLVMLGSLGTAWTAIIAYYYGSSRGSDLKTSIMAGK